MPTPRPTPDPVDEATQAREADDLAQALHAVEHRLTAAQRATQFGLRTDPHTLYTLLHSPDQGRTGRRAS